MAAVGEAATVGEIARGAVRGHGALSKQQENERRVGLLGRGGLEGRGKMTKKKKKAHSTRTPNLRQSMRYKECPTRR